MNSMRRMSSLLITLILAGLVAPTAAAEPEEVPEHRVEIGVLGGFFLPDQDLSAKDNAIQDLEPTGGGRIAVLFADHWDWYLDALFSDVNSNLIDPDTSAPVGDVETIAARTGVDFYFRPHGKKVRWFVSGGVGLIDVDLEFIEDFRRTLAALGVGQRVRLDRRASFRWEIRHDVMFDGNDVVKGQDLQRTYALIGVTWGLGRSKRDSDGDGVLDRHDDCPGTPPGATVDERGCPSDSDGDGVYDGIDRCPDTPRGATVDQWGCPKDSDGDGVYDGIDQCPDTPRGTPVRPDGCPRVEPLFKLEKQTLILEGVFFEYDKAVLLPQSRDTLDRVAQSLRDWNDIRVEIAGHTDWIGTEEYNQDLSHRRAWSVKEYLTDSGVPAERMTVRGYGESQPIADNHSKGGRATNRRVELKRLK